MRNPKSLLLTATLAAMGGVALHAPSAEARTYVSVYATTAPPPMREEIVPAPRHGYVWVPGEWRWRHHHYVWHRGYWAHERHGYRYVPSRWEREGDRWRYYDSRWDR